MTKIQLLYRKLEVKIFNKKYCSMTSIHGHDFNYTHGNNKHGYERLVFFKCSVCNKRAYVDATGMLIDMDS